MALRAVYEQFLVEPTTSALTDDASLSYITTLVTISDATPILKHFAAQNKQLKRKGDKVLSATESRNSLCLETETAVEFLTGGGAFLPGLDDNFLADRTVSFPAIHIVHFDANQKIQRIRLHWDQGSLLKQVDVIGARSRNWPIRDGKEQLRLIASGGAPSTPSTRPTTGSRDLDDVSNRSRAGSQHSSVSGLHEILSPPQGRGRDPFPTFSPRESAKPTHRDLTGILAGSDAEDEEPSNRSPSPKRKNGNALKAGAGKNYLPNRLFEENEMRIPEPSPERKKSMAKKHGHFEFGDGDEAKTHKASAGLSKTANKHASQWDFADFMTPEKPSGKTRAQDVRHIDWQDDEDGRVSPVKRPVVHHERPTSRPHFDFTDEATPKANDKAVPGRSTGGAHNKGLGLYTSAMRPDSEDHGDKAPKGALSDLSTNPNTQHRHKDFDSSWEMTDDSPTVRDAKTATNGKHVPEDTKKVIKGLDANWDMYDQSPGRKENVPNEQGRGIAVGGNGMGGRKNADRHWGFGDDSDEEANKVPPKYTGRGRGPPQPQGGNFWDF